MALTLVYVSGIRCLLMENVFQWKMSVNRECLWQSSLPQALDIFANNGECGWHWRMAQTMLASLVM